MTAVAQTADFAGRALSLKDGFVVDYSRRSIVAEGMEFVANNYG